MLSTRVKLSVMMFLEFFIWGAWYPLVFDYSAQPRLLGRGSRP